MTFKFIVSILTFLIFLSLLYGSFQVPNLIDVVEQNETKGFGELDLSLTRGLIGFWTLNEGVGNIITNLADGDSEKLFNTEWKDDELYFNGGGSFVNLGNNSYLDICGNDFTIALWVKWSEETGNARDIIRFSTPERGCALSTGYHNSGQDKLAFGISYKEKEAFQNKSSDEHYNGWWRHGYGFGLNDNKWHFVVVRKKENQILVSIDNIIVKELFEKERSFIVGNQLGGGSYGNHDSFYGFIKTLSLYNRSLLDKEVDFLFQK